MKRISLILIVVLIGCLSAARAASEEEKVLEFERQWCAAYSHGDTAFLKKFVVDDFTLTNSKGQISTKADDLKEIANGTVKYEIFENREMKARIYGDTAVVTGWTKVKGTVEGKPYETDVAFTDTLTRINGEWHGVAGHVSKPPAK
jgi:ketosteroid isomerase-like protein